MPLRTFPGGIDVFARSIVDGNRDGARLFTIENERRVLVSNLDTDRAQSSLPSGRKVVEHAALKAFAVRVIPLSA